MANPVRRLVRAILPTPQRAPSWRSAGPLVGFLLAFAGLCALLHATKSVAFTQRWPFALLVLTPWVWWVWLCGSSGLTAFRSRLALLFRLALLSLLIVTLTEPRAVRSNDRQTVIFAVDQSGSMTVESTDAALQFISRVGHHEKPSGEQAGLVTFARSPSVQLPPKSNLATDELRVIDVDVDREGTNLAEALALAAAVIPESDNGRIVLATDGVATEGELSPVLDELRRRDIAVDVLPIDYQYEDEVWLERLDLPQQVKEGQAYEASVILSSLKPGSGTLVLLENGQTILEQSVEFGAGKNRYSVPIRLRQPGYYEYVVRIEPATVDHVQKNNVAMGELFLKGRGQTLVVTDPLGEQAEAAPLVRALEQASFDVRTLSAYETPQDSFALQAYDCVILPNVGRKALDPLQMQALHDAVFHHGVGLLMVGGPQSFGPGGWKGTVIEKALPVDMEIPNRKVLMNGALVLVLDHSGSMSGAVPGTSATKQQLANRAAVAAIGTMTQQDWLGVVSFDGRFEWNVSFGPNTHPDRSVQRVLAIGPGGGTDMHPALDGALIAMNRLPEGTAAIKHIIVLTDGQSAPGDVQGFIRRCRDAKISVSTLGVGPSGDPGHRVLELIASGTGGRFYPVEDATRLPRILVREAVTLRQNAIREQPLTLEAYAGSSVLKGIGSLPLLQGMVLTTPKERAEVVLATPSALGNDELDPILAVHGYGLGRTAAFTSDLSSRWGRDWLGWDHYQAFVLQLVGSIARVDRPGTLQVSAFADGTTGVIQVEDHGQGDDLRDVLARVEGPGGMAQNLKLDQTGPRLFRARFPLNGEGRYQVVVADGEQSKIGGFVVPFSREYLRFRAQPSVVKEIAAATGGRVLTGRETSAEIYTSDRGPKLRTRSMVVVLLQILAILIPLDVALRRIQLDGSVLRGWFARESVESGKTMSVLLERKTSASSTLRRQQRGLVETKAGTVETSRPTSIGPARQQLPVEPAARASLSDLAARKRERRG